LLKGTSVKVCSVVGFPLGANASAVKALEAKKCVEEGAEEIDMVMNIGFLRSGKYDIVEKDIKKVVENTKPNIIVKVILETGFLTDEEKRIACNIAESAGAHFVKTSTGLWNFGATVEDVRLMKEVVKNRMEVKAAGGIRTYEQAIKMIEAGASRIGTSTGVDIVL
jgi:deoxyribose-phosphate aldolase